MAVLRSLTSAEVEKESGLTERSRKEEGKLTGSRTGGEILSGTVIEKGMGETTEVMTGTGENEIIGELIGGTTALT